MKLKEFIEKFVEPNTLIRLWYPIEHGHQMITKGYNDVSMEWEILKGIGIYKDYSDHIIKGVTDILISEGNYREAINIVIERKEEPIIPTDAHSLEVFAIKDNVDSPTGKEAFIGFKLNNDNFHFVGVPFTDSKFIQ